jgi:hypothetical protein
MKYLFLMMAFIISFNSLAQHKKVWLELSAGVGAGWWVYNKGSVNPNNFNDLGQDQTHSTGVIDFNVGLLYQIKRWKAGIRLSHSLFLEDKMSASDDSEYYSHRYKIAENAVTFQKYALQLSFDVVDEPKIAIAPLVRLGTFDMQTLHPEKYNFGSRAFWEVGILNQIKFKKFIFLIQPQYTHLSILPKQAKHAGENHKIYHITIQTGVAWKI